MKHSHYHRSVQHLDTIDIYRILQLYGVTDACIQHAVKKLLCAGQRGAKAQDQDVQEAIDTLARYQQMQGEDNRGECSDCGWVEWSGGENPPSGSTLVDYKMRGNEKAHTDMASNIQWQHYGNGADIIAYRLSTEATE